MVRKREYEDDVEPAKQEKEIQLVTENQLLNSKQDYIIRLLERLLEEESQ